MYKNLWHMLFFLWMVCSLFLQGCCPDKEDEPGAIYRLLVKYPVTSYRDSNGSTIQIILGEGTYDRLEDPWDQCSNAVQYVRVPIAQFDIIPSNGNHMTYRDLYDHLIFKDFGTQIWSGLPRVDTVIQGQSYHDCLLATKSDSLGEVYSVIVNPDYGIVMISYRDEYRWERVLD